VEEDETQGNVSTERPRNETKQRDDLKESSAQIESTHMTSDPGGDTDTSAVSRRVDGASNVSKKQVDLERSKSSWAVKWQYQTVVEETARVAIWANQSHREVSRAFGTTERLSTVPNTMGYVPAMTGTSASSKRTREVEEPGQEAIWASQRRRETSRAIGAAKAMEMA